METYQVDLSEIALRIRREIVRMVYSAQSGHPGGSLSIADILTVLQKDRFTSGGSCFKRDPRR